VRLLLRFWDGQRRQHDIGKNTKKHHEKTKTIVEKHQNEQAHDLRKQSEDSKIKEMAESILYS
jgi:hypothetical protein